MTLIVAALFYALVRDQRQGRSCRRPQGTLSEVFRGLWEVWRGLLPLLAMHFFAYATMLTLLGVGRAYLFDVHKLDGVQRGNVLLAMAIAQTVGILAYGPMDRVLRSRKKVVLAGTYLSAAVLLALALVARPPLWLAVALLVAVCFFCAYGTVSWRKAAPCFPIAWAAAASPR